MGYSFNFRDVTNTRLPFWLSTWHECRLSQMWSKVLLVSTDGILGALTYDTENRVRNGQDRSNASEIDLPYHGGSNRFGRAVSNGAIESCKILISRKKWGPDIIFTLKINCSCKEISEKPPSELQVWRVISKGLKTCQVISHGMSRDQRLQRMTKALRSIPISRRSMWAPCYWCGEPWRYWRQRGHVQAERPSPGVWALRL